MKHEINGFGVLFWLAVFISSLLWTGWWMEQSHHWWNLAVNVLTLMIIVCSISIFIIALGIYLDNK